MARPDEVDLWALSDLCTPWCVRTVATLRIAEQIADGVSRIDDLAAVSGADADTLHRVLRHLAAKGVFDETAPGHFALNEPARALLDPTMRLGLDLEGIGGRMAYAWSGLLQMVRSGRPAYHEIFGRPFWEDLDAHPEIAASFDALMGPMGHGARDPDVLVTGDWKAVRTVVDVGGGTGALLAAILQAHPAVRGTLVDLPRTVARSAEIFQTADVAERMTCQGQSFFDPLPAGADLYLLSRVLNDWADAEAAAILRRCAEAAYPNGRIVVVGSVSLDSPSSRVSEEMVLVGGKDRTMAEFRDLARAGGLDVQRVGRQPSGCSLVECRPFVHAVTNSDPQTE